MQEQTSLADLFRGWERRQRRCDIGCLVTWLWMVVCLMPGTLLAEEKAHSDPERIRAATQALRDGEVESALKSLSPLSDSAKLIPLAEQDQLFNICGGLHRSLAQLSADQQFELLSRWTFPAESPAAIRLLSGLVATEAPPSEFARALGERPHANSFPVASIGRVRGIFSTAWTLVCTARDVGRLKKLQTDLSPRAERDPSARLLLLLAFIADERADMQPVADHLSSRITAISPADNSNSPVVTGIDRNELVLVIAALGRTELCPLAERYIQLILNGLKGQPAAGVRPFLRRAHAIASLLTEGPAGTLDTESALSSPLRYWIPVPGGFTQKEINGFHDATWLVHENHLLHLSGAVDDCLMMRYPLTGEFEFQVESQIDGRRLTDGGIAYDGMKFQVKGGNGAFDVLPSIGQFHYARYCPFAHRPDMPLFHRWTINSTATTSTVKVNLHPMWRSGSSQSPWIGLVSRGEDRPLYRNIQLSGQPQIPSEVPLVNPQLLGWASQSGGLGNESRNTKAPDQPAANSWNIAAGIIQAPSTSSPTSPQRLLTYLRPLQDDETIQYKFFYAPGKSEVSPALGRLAFLLQSDGIGVRWICESDDWSMLPVNNKVVEPLNRRGPRPLPLKLNDWNRLAISRAKQVVSLTLNNELIYLRRIEGNGEQQFGLYQHDLKAAVKVRDVVLSGDWPQQLPPEFMTNPLALLNPTVPAATRRAFHRLFGEKSLASNVYAVRRQALAMPIEDRYRFLSDWILPGPDHPVLRVTGEFPPTNPAPPARHVKDGELGIPIVSPVLDWIDAARQLGKLNLCAQQVEAVIAADDEQKRARLSLLLLAGLESADQAAQDRLWDELSLVLKNEPPNEAESHWPELLLVASAIAKHPEHPRCLDLITELATQRVQRWKGSDLDGWHEQLWKLYEAGLQRKRQGAAKTSTELRDWISVTGVHSKSFGLGHPNTNWERTGDTVVKTAGSDRDYLFYRLPIAGDFQLECDLIQPNLYRIGVQVGGLHVGPERSLKTLLTGPVNGELLPTPLEPPLFMEIQRPMHFRAEVAGNRRTVYLNGRKVHDSQMPSVRDPWIAFRSSIWAPSSVARAKILGQPQVPRAVEISSIPDLTGWIAYHEDGQWAHSGRSEPGAEIIGKVNPGLRGISAEGLLRYQRPLLDRDSIEYEFFYEPGRVETSPALDRLAFLLDPAGIREHWITDGKYGPVEMSPDNLTDHPENRRGVATLPLNINGWNHLSITIRDSTALLTLNHQPVYERVLAPAAGWAFGLFHYVDTESRVRNVVLSGDWPQTVAAETDQELAGDTLAWLDADPSRLKSVFTHRFDSEGLPEEYFELTNPYRIRAAENGVTVAIGPGAPENQNSSEIIPRFTASGDFDLEAAFEKLTFTPPEQYCFILLRATFDEPETPAYDLQRAYNKQLFHNYQAAQLFTKPSRAGRWMWRGEGGGWEAVDGRLRIARREKKLYYLVADGSSAPFRVVHQLDVSTADLAKQGIRIQALGNGGAVSVLWKSIQLRAERLTWHQLPGKLNRSILKVLPASGGDGTTIAQPSALGLSSLGTPEWSPDGRKIIFDMSNGTTLTSHIVEVDADGKNLTDLGLGCMPSYSSDAKRIVFSIPRNGIMTMNSDGSGREVLDDRGWGAQWSPDGKWIAYGKTGNITLFNVATQERRELLLGDHAQRYSYIYWNLGWSPDSQSIVFMGRLRTTNLPELSVIKIDQPDQMLVLLPDASKVHPDLTFTPDGKLAVAPMDMGDKLGCRLYSLSLTNPTEIKHLDSVLPEQTLQGGAWSRDGRSIAISIPTVAESVEWKAEMKSKPSSQ